MTVFIWIAAVVVLGFLITLMVALRGSTPAERAVIIRALAELARGLRGSNNKVIEHANTETPDEKRADSASTTSKQ
ncbi:hypothetical protein [Actinocrispum wychmicini]|uniref:Uncharacterized protein n=1 Tax=Actinocrispum wychmicini TaxID=1213861 RepID=A0A4R2JV32_9PSEU|nr:hypothetical protein [Actinocrispum wychmicini]TCO64263.1 hypothetical protein EV192_10127 [Actinocrispum wychmicini]